MRGREGEAYPALCRHVTTCLRVFEPDQDEDTTLGDRRPPTFKKGVDERSRVLGHRPQGLGGSPSPSLGVLLVTFFSVRNYRTGNKTFFYKISM